eukprot:874004-Rhodomonas_salina.1
MQEKLVGTNLLTTLEAEFLGLLHPPYPTPSPDEPRCRPSLCPALLAPSRAAWASARGCVLRSREGRPC